MTAVADPAAASIAAASAPPLSRAEGVELLGAVHGSGYRDGVALVRRADGQMVQLGQLMYALLECADGERDPGQLAAAMSERLGRRVQTQHVDRLASKLARQGLLAGTEHRAPPRRNPLLALRWKVLVTNPEITRRLTAPLTFLFRPWVMWPMVAGFGAVFWFVLIHKGVASATTQAFRSPALLLVVFALAVASAGFHELGHAAACRYGGATPGGMGVGLYLVWPAFYTDVTDAYRLPRRARLRVDLGGLYFNAVVAVVTLAIWLAVRSDALLLLVALQVLQMVKQLSPVIRADGYHILSDATGVPDLYSHMGPTLRRLLPGHRRDPSALTGWARLFVTLWVLIIVPVLISLSLGAVLLFPRLATSAWDSGRTIINAIPHQASHGQVLELLAALVRLLALALPVFGSVLVMQRIVRRTVARAADWSQGHPGRRAAAVAVGAAALAGVAWAWWPAGQYQPVRATRGGTLGGLIRLVSSPTSTARPFAAVPGLSSGEHLAVVMLPVGGSTPAHPALFVIPNEHGHAVAIVSEKTPPPGQSSSTQTNAGSGRQNGAPAGAGSTASGGPAAAAAAAGGAAPSSTSAPGAAFSFKLPAAPGPGGTQAVATNTTNGGVRYDVAYALVTVSGGAPVTETNSAYALAHCSSCTTVAVSFQVVLIVGRSKIIAPIDAAGSLNDHCPACTTVAIADQMVVMLKSIPTPKLVAELDAALARLGAISQLGAAGSPTVIASDVAAVQQEIATEIAASGLAANATGAATATGTSSSASAATTSTTTSAPAGNSGATTSSATQNVQSQSVSTTSTQSVSASSTSAAAGNSGQNTGAPANAGSTGSGG